jgi:MFS family permease
MVNLFANSAYSSIAPFYPGEAVSKGVPESMLGFVFSSYSVAMFIFSPLFKMMLDRFGSKPLLIIGLLAEGVSMIVFGLFDYIEDPAWYAACSMLCRFLEGFGNGCLNSGCK